MATRKKVAKSSGASKKAAKGLKGAGKSAEAEAAGEELLTLPQAIDLLQTTRQTFYRWLKAGRIKGMKIGRQWRFRKADIERFLAGRPAVVDLPIDASIDPLLATLTARLKAVGGAPSPVGGDNDIERAVNTLILLAAETRASDIHIDPYEKTARVRLRVDGVLDEVAEFDLRILPALVERMKQMAACNVRERQLPQDGRIGIRLATPDGPREMDLRVCFLPALTGEAVTVRLLQRQHALINLDRIDQSDADRQRLLRAIGSPWGLVVISGPTGSGKTTVLYACLQHLVNPGVKILSVEDPVEYFIPGVVQVQLMEKAGMTFERAIRACLRSDPDVMLIGELRSSAALMGCFQAALTGHLVLTTLHADTAAGTLKRMVDMDAPPFVIADATRLVAGQRLVRLLCPKCSEPDTPGDEDLQRAEQLAREGGLGWAALPKEFRKPVGCPECARHGYRGRAGIFELLEVTPEIGKALRRGASTDEMRAIAVGQGMTTMGADGIRRAAAGQTTLAEVFRVLSLR